MPDTTAVVAAFDAMLAAPLPTQVDGATLDLKRALGLVD